MLNVCEASHVRSPPVSPWDSSASPQNDKISAPLSFRGMAQPCRENLCTASIYLHWYSNTVTHLLNNFNIFCRFSFNSLCLTSYIQYIVCFYFLLCSSFPPWDSFASLLRLRLVPPLSAVRVHSYSLNIGAEWQKKILSVASLPLNDKKMSLLSFRDMA